MGQRGTRTPMIDPITARLRLSQWLSPTFPVSGFAYSHGLETAIATDKVTDSKTLFGWLDGILRAGACQSDGVLVAHAASGSCLEMLAEHAEALAGSAERWAETRDQGAAFVETSNALCDTQLPVLPYPVAVGARARELDLPAAEVVALYLQAFLGNLTSGAVRLIPLGQTQGQRVVQMLHRAISEEALRLVGLPLEDIGMAAFHSDLAAMAHEVAEVRIFRT